MGYETCIEYFYDRENWKQIQIRAMNQDFSWDKQALEYFSLYNSLLSIDTRVNYFGYK